MPLSEPSWWYKTDGRMSWQAWALQPFSKLYGWMAGRRMLRNDGLDAPLPVICVGNFTAGGTGKTPLACWVAERLKDHGAHPVFLTRGYGGRLKGPVWVDTDHHTAHDVGDEPLLLARRAPVVVAANRAAGAVAASASDERFDVIIMDDGLQNPLLKKDLAVAVVDGVRGLGNGHEIPAGPLRAPLAVQATRVDAVVINHGAEREEAKARHSKLATQMETAGFQGPVLSASVSVVGDLTLLHDEQVLAYAGIGNPERFFDTVRALGGKIKECQTFQDHHELTAGEAQALLKIAADHQLSLVTTEKDWVRISSDQSDLAELKKRSRVVPITIEFSEPDGRQLESMILECVRPSN